jgi:hypothetical protein
MSKKIELSEEQTLECLRLYNEELMGSPSISKRMGIHKTIIIRTLKENGVIITKSGRRNIGGRVLAQEKYNTKPEVKIKKLVNYKIWAKDKKEYLKEKHTKWREKNREHVNQYARDYERKRRAEDPKYRLGVRTRTAVWQMLKERNVNKTNKTFALLGYSLEELMAHLEKQFTEGMTWDNYGEWHVDHIRPMTSFNFETTDDPEFKECWSLDNLRPLWEFDNLSKGTKLL